MPPSSRAAETVTPAAPRAAATRPAHRAAARTTGRKSLARAPRSAPPTRLGLSNEQRRSLYESSLAQIPAAPLGPPVATNSFLPPFMQPVFPPPVATIPNPQVVTGEVFAPFGYAAMPPSAFGARAAVPQENYVGRHLPKSVTLVAVPDLMLMQTPSLRRYRYTVINDHMLLVDPATRRVVADMGRPL